MKEIKFRAWDKTNSKWVKDVVIDGFNGNLLRASGADEYDIVYDFEYEIVQYTGLKDKNGKEIYEGDILKEDYGNKIGVVEYDKEMVGFIVCDFVQSSGSGDYYGSINDECEIIGNIYENPELLKTI